MSILRIMPFSIALLLTGVAYAEPMLTDDQIFTISGSMYKAYQSGGVNNMYNQELKCWKDASKTKRADKVKVETCMTMAISGAFVEASYARQQMRGSVPQYTVNEVNKRIEKSSRMTENELEALRETLI